MRPKEEFEDEEVKLEESDKSRVEHYHMTTLRTRHHSISSQRRAEMSLRVGGVCEGWDGGQQILWLGQGNRSVTGFGYVEGRALFVQGNDMRECMVVEYFAECSRDKTN